MLIVLLFYIFMYILYVLGYACISSKNWCVGGIIYLLAIAILVYVFKAQPAWIYARLINHKFFGYILDLIFGLLIFGTIAVNNDTTDRTDGQK